MAKDKVIIGGGSDIVGGSYDQTIRDALSPGLLVCCNNGYGLRNPANRVVAVHPAITQRSAETALWTMGFYPYNPAKMVYDRMRMLWRVSTEVAATLNLQYSLDSGASFTNAVTNVAGAPVITPPSDLGTVTLNAGQSDVALTSIGQPQWLVWRVSDDTGGADVIQWQVYVFLWRLDVPFTP